LQNIDILFFYDCFFCPSECIVALDILLRAVRNQLSTPFGGVFVILIGDHFQTSPINSTFILTTTLVREWFTIHNPDIARPGVVVFSTRDNVQQAHDQMLHSVVDCDKIIFHTLWNGSLVKVVDFTSTSILIQPQMHSDAQPIQ